MSVAKETFKISLRLGLFALVCTLILALVNEVSIGKIEQNILEVKTAKLAQTLPEGLEYDNDLSSSLMKLSTDAEKQAKKAGIGDIYVASKAGQTQAVVIETMAPNGYGGKINLLVGILANGQVSGVRVVSHKETAGLGDYIDAEKSMWSEQFIGVPVQKRLSLKKEGGQIEHRAGATISARAVTKSVDQAASFYLQHQDDLKVIL